MNKVGNSRLGRMGCGFGGSLPVYAVRFLGLISHFTYLTCLAWPPNDGGQAFLSESASPKPEASRLEPAAPGPRIQFATNALALGRVAGGTTVRCDFAFTNTGQSTLEIKDVKASCGCTTAGHWTRSVAPGAWGIIPLQLEAPNVDTSFSKAVSISCNDPTQPQVSLALTGAFWVAVDIKPPLASFNFGDADDTNPIKTVRLTSRLKEPLTLSPPELAHTNFQAELKTVKPGKEFELKVRYLTRPTAGASFTTPIKLGTSSADLPVIRVNVVALVPPPIEVKPQRFVIWGPQRPGSAPLSVTIRNHLDIPLKLSSPEVSIPGLQVELYETEPGQAFKLDLAFPAGLKSVAGQSERVTIATSDPEHPKLEIPVMTRDLAPLRTGNGRVGASRSHQVPGALRRQAQPALAPLPAAAGTEPSPAVATSPSQPPADIHALADRGQAMPDP